MKWSTDRGREVNGAQSTFIDNSHVAERTTDLINKSDADSDSAVRDLKQRRRRRLRERCQKILFPVTVIIFAIAPSRSTCDE